MADQLTRAQRHPDPDVRDLAQGGSPKTIRSSHLEDGATMNAGNEVTVWKSKVPADKAYLHGHGTDNRESGPEAFIYASIQNSTPEQIEGDLYAVITDSEGRDVHARKEIGDLETLAAAEDDNRTERPMYPVQVPIAREDQHLELRVVADSASDGDELSASDSSIRMYYTEYNN
ncbi:hypothetical protein [Natrinema versiforme]|uniref:Uncharacterized protein n=1 Tax=Natrinema versiforme JCM 10478 TaxID=1227496 RepID=L9Y5I9_9EURY|nr:hypothetical protein [Natrinema versiforme]ELY69329.1 hypothetical protein C489_05228 [Natrinema versiforme JCM 10478]